METRSREPRPEPPVAGGDDEVPPATSPPARRPFEAPALLWSEPFQPVAYGMSCGKISGISEKCNSSPQLS